MPTILVVDDVDSLRAQLRDALTAAGLGLTVVEARDGAEALPIVLSGQADIVLSDLVMPKLDGIGLLRAIRQAKSADVLPVIIVTSEREQPSRDLGFEAGASDYLTRPFSTSELLARVQIQLRLLALQRELSQANDRHGRESLVDDLTGLSNRRHFLAECERELSRCRRHQIAFTIAIADIDHLRELNDRIGHRDTDALIAAVGATIRGRLRQGDLTARISGGKFAVLLSHTDAGQGAIVVERLRATVGNSAYLSLAAGQVTVALGTASFPGGHSESVQELVNQAEKNLDLAKAQGGNSAVVAPGIEPSKP